MTEFCTTRRIEFADTDVVGICHFARFFVFMESAEHEMFESLGSGPLIEEEGRSIGWPRASATCDYRRPVQFRDRLSIKARVVRVGKTSLTCAYRFEHEGALVAEGQMTTVCCDLSGKPKPTPIPAQLRRRLEKYSNVEGPEAG